MHACPITTERTNNVGSYRCKCIKGYAGKTCSDIDECSAKTHQCHKNQTCENTVGSYECHCNLGYYKNSSSVCADVDECSLGTHSCPQKSICLNDVGSYTCFCIPGFQGENCDDIDECSTVPCSVNQTCTNIIGSYTCDCKKGYGQVSDKSCADINECIVNKTPCKSGLTCKNTDGSFLCYGVNINILVLNTYKSEKSVIISGDSHWDAKIKFESGTSVSFGCSLIFQNYLYVFGGDYHKSSYARQISQLKGSELKRIESLAFNYYMGACANLNNEYIYLCFSDSNQCFSDSNKCFSEFRLCRFSLGPQKTFHKVAESTDKHLGTNIAASTSKFF